MPILLHMKTRTRRTNQAIIAIMASCKSIKEIRAKFPWAYHAMHKRGLVAQHGAHLKSERKILSIEEIADIAKSFKHKIDFKNTHPSLYRRARKSSIFDKICSHMTPAKRLNEKNRTIYRFVFEDRTAYVGLTIDPKRRRDSHLNDRKSAVFKKMQSGIEFIFEILEEAVSPLMAPERELFWANKSSYEGLTLLNKAKFGSLGGNQRKWTKEVVLNLASKCVFLKEFIEIFNGAYLAALANDWLKETSLIRKKKNWTKEELREIAAKFKTIGKFKKENPNAYMTAYNRDLLNEIASHMKRR